MKNQIKTVFTFAFITALANSCVKIPSDNEYPDISKYTVHVAGQLDYRIGCYWKNGERTDLNATESRMRATSTGISVSNGYVYVSGHYDTDHISCHVPCYWKNGQKTDLPLNGYFGGYTNDIFVSGSDVYVAGMVTAAIKDKRFEILQPCYWKNNTLVVITDYPDLFENILEFQYDETDLPVKITCIHVSNGDVYVGGKYDKGDKKDNYYREPKQACYWRNGVRTDLPGNNSFVNGIFVDGGKVYASGGCDFFAQTPYETVGSACYWVDGQKVDLSNGGSYASTSAIFVENGTAYISGSACYWKNKSKTVLNAKRRGAHIVTKSIFVKDGIVFTCGSYDDWTNNDHFELPCYWANKKFVPLPGAERWGQATGIFVE